MKQFSRTEKIIGKNNLSKIKNTSILIVGIGGVGGSALEMLARSGIENIVVADFDQFEESNLNRQILSLQSNIGLLKVEAAKDRIKDINSSINIYLIKDKIDDNSIKNIPKSDFMVSLF